MIDSLRLNELHFSYPEKEILRGASLRVIQGSVLGVLGASGSGKSTLFKCILQLLTPTAGRLVYWQAKKCYFGKENQLERHVAERDLLLIRRSIGYLPQEATLFPFLNARDNVSFALIHAQGVRRSEALAKADELLCKLGLSAHVLKFPWQLSGGQVQRVALARAMVSAKSLLLLDEPTSAQDAASSISIANILREHIAAHDMGALVITHNFGFANLFCDSVAFLKDGTLSDPKFPNHVDWSGVVRELI